MTDEELEGLRRRFGADISAWPAPYRQEAEWLLTRPDRIADGDEDARIDRLILRAAQMETDEGELARKVQERLGQGRRRPLRVAAIMPAWRIPAAAASCAAVLVMAGLAGYAIGGAGLGGVDDALLALAAGETPMGVLGVGWPAPDALVGEEGFL